MTREIKLQFVELPDQRIVDAKWMDAEFVRNAVSGNPLPEGWAVRQFTGLLDKNGKEIYEGDILKGNGDFDKTAIVEWEGGGFHGVGGYKHMGHNFFKDLEIIGNIYENPKLL